MAQFYASVSGARDSVATKTGTKASGINAHVRGWDKGIAVRGFVDKDGKEKFVVQLTGGSNNESVVKEIGIF